jgi:RNA polymerase sigma-70 factor (ECF subfamily)
MHRITTNLFLDGARRRARIRFVPLPDDTERLPDSSGDPERLACDARLDADLERALASLPPDFRAAVLLADVQQVPYEEIAALQGVKIGTVRSRIHRGRLQLRTALERAEPVPA